MIFRGITSIVIVVFLTSCGNSKNENKYVSLDLDWKLHEQGDAKKIPASVPGDVFTTLLTNAKIPHPFYMDNAEELGWIGEKNWMYETKWNVNDSLLAFSRIDLMLGGLDTYARVFLNGKEILTTDNMFREYEINVRPFLQIGDNMLKILLQSPSEEAMNRAQEFGMLLPADNDVGDFKLSPFARKAGIHFGWDFAPRMLTSGIWSPVKARFSNGVFVRDVAFDYSLNEAVAGVQGNVRIHSDGDKDVVVRIKHDGAIVGHQSVKLRSGNQVAAIAFELEEIELWWPKGYGGQPRYEFVVEILENGQVVDTRKELIGFRTIQLDRGADSKGSKFQFVVNGKPVFMKGSNVVPPVRLKGQSQEDAWRGLVNTAIESNMNMLRVWGGGVYPPNSFFTACDEAGIMVWQDFMFANTMIPDNPAFFRNVELEVIDQVTRIRNHPCLALWCGNNEIEVAWNNWGWQKTYQIGVKDSLRMINAYKRLFEKNIPGWMRSLDSKTPYLSTSPISNWGNEAGLNNGDLHYWGVFHGDASIDEFKNNVGRFISEYGMQSYPSFKTLAFWSDSVALYGPSDFWNSRQKSYKKDGPILDLVESLYWKPLGPEEFVRLGQIAQKAAYAEAIESHRFAADHCAGTLYWQLNDVWPGASWSAIEYDGKWKPAQYGIQDAYAPNLMRFIDEEDSLRIELFNESDSLRGKLALRLFHYTGKLLWSDELPVTRRTLNLGPNWKFQTRAAKNKIMLFAEWVNEGGEVLAEKAHLWVKPGDYWQLEPEFKVNRVHLGAGQYQFELTTDKPVWCTWLSCNAFEPDDQAFSMSPDRVKTVRIRKEWEKDALKFISPKAVKRKIRRRYQDPSLFSGQRLTPKNQ